MSYTPFPVDVQPVESVPPEEIEAAVAAYLSENPVNGENELWVYLAVLHPDAVPQFGGTINPGVSVTVPPFDGVGLPAGVSVLIYSGTAGDPENGAYSYTGADGVFEWADDQPFAIENATHLVRGLDLTSYEGGLQSPFVWGLWGIVSPNGADVGIEQIAGPSTRSKYRNVRVVYTMVAIPLEDIGLDITGPNQTPYGIRVALVNQTDASTNGIYEGRTLDPSDPETWVPSQRVEDLPNATNPVDSLIVASQLFRSVEEGDETGPWLLSPGSSETTSFYHPLGLVVEGSGWGIVANLGDGGGGFSGEWDDLSGRPGWLTEGDGYGDGRWHEVTAIIYNGSSDRFIDVDGSWVDYEVQGYTPSVGDNVFIASHPNSSTIGVYAVTDEGPWTKLDGDAYGSRPVFYAMSGANRFRPFRGNVVPGSESGAAPMDGPPSGAPDAIGKFRGTAQFHIRDRTWDDGDPVPTEWEDGYGRLKSTDDIADGTRVLISWPQEHTDGRYWPPGVYQWNKPEEGDPWLDLIAEVKEFDWVFVQFGPLGPRHWQHPGYNLFLRPGGANGEASEAYPTRVSFAVNWQNQPSPVEDPYVGIADYETTPVDDHTFAGNQTVLVFNAADMSMNGLWIVSAEGQPWVRWVGNAYYGQSGRKRTAYVTDGAYEGQLFFRDSDITNGVNDWYRIMLPERVVERVDLTGATPALTRTHVGKLVELSNGSDPMTVVVPLAEDVAWEVGTVLRFVAMGTGTVTFEGDTGVTLLNAGDLSGQYAEATLRCRDEDDWILTGDIV